MRLAAVDGAGGEGEAVLAVSDHSQTVMVGLVPTTHKHRGWPDKAMCMDRRNRSGDDER
jgi:hypothetical protein